MGTLPRTGTVSVEVDASPEQVWTLLTDITRAGEWGHENTGGEWLGGASGPVPGARFHGRNAQGSYKWTRQCEVLAVDPCRSISWRTIPTRVYRDSTIWTYVIEPTERGSRITQSFEIVQLGRVMDRVLYAVVPAHRDRSEALEGDVRRLGEQAAHLVAVQYPARCFLGDEATGKRHVELGMLTQLDVGAGRGVSRRPRPGWSRRS